MFPAEVKHIFPVRSALIESRLSFKLAALSGSGSQFKTLHLKRDHFMTFALTHAERDTRRERSFPNNEFKLTTVIAGSEVIPLAKAFFSSPFISSSHYFSQCSERSRRPSEKSEMCPLSNWPAVLWSGRSSWARHAAAGYRPRDPGFGYRLPFWPLSPWGPCNCVRQRSCICFWGVSLTSGQWPETKRKPFKMYLSVQKMRTEICTGFNYIVKYPKATCCDSID